MRDVFYIDPAAAIGVTVAMALALDRKPPHLMPPSQATLARLYDEAKREDWNRSVAARKAARKAGKTKPEGV